MSYTTDCFFCILAQTYGLGLHPCACVDLTRRGVDEMDACGYACVFVCVFILQGALHLGVWGKGVGCGHKWLYYTPKGVGVGERGSVALRVWL